MWMWLQKYIIWVLWNCITLYVDVVTEVYKMDMGVMELYYIVCGCGSGGIVAITVEEGAQCYNMLV